MSKLIFTLSIIIALFFVANIIPNESLRFARPSHYITIIKGPAYNFNTHRYGEFVLPEITQSSLSLLRNQNVKIFAISTAYKKNEILRTRLMESSYPIKYTNLASSYLDFVNSQIPISCEIISKTKEVQFVVCTTGCKIILAEKVIHHKIQNGFYLDCPM